MGYIRVASVLVLGIVVQALGMALASGDQEWEYLVVSYGKTYFASPLDVASEDGELAYSASLSKISLFSDLGITIPNEAVTLQRNIDVLGRFAWELVAVVGEIGGDQQLVFKRPYDPERSAAEADRVRAEREELLALYVAGRGGVGQEEPGDAGPPLLVDLDAVERAIAVAARNERDANIVNALVESAAGWGFTLLETEIEGRAFSPTADAEVNARIILDVTDAALVEESAYRRSLVDAHVDEFWRRLLATRGDIVESDYSFCMYPDPSNTVQLAVSAAIRHHGVTTTVGRFAKTLCY